MDKDRLSKIEYDPNCYLCRQEHGKPPAGIADDELCVGHLQAEVKCLREAAACRLATPSGGKP